MHYPRFSVILKTAFPKTGVLFLLCNLAVLKEQLLCAIFISIIQLYYLISVSGLRRHYSGAFTRGGDNYDTFSRGQIEKKGNPRESGKSEE